MSNNYEMHITVEPGNGFDKNTFVERFTAGWRFSCFDEDDVDGIAGKWFLTRHASSLESAMAALRSECDTLTHKGFIVSRSKVEHVVFDTKHGDKL